MASALRSALALSLVSAALALGAPGCSQQGEGERCDSAKNGSADCETEFTCVISTQLLDQSADRCCPAAGTESDKRCTRLGSTGNGTAGSSSAGSSSGGSSGSAGSGNAAGNESAGGSDGSGGTSDAGGTGGSDAAGGTSAAGAAGSPEESLGGAAGGAG